MIDQVGALHSPGGTLISLYVTPRPPATRAALVDIIRTLKVNGLEHGPAKSVRADCERIIELASRMEADQVPAVAVFTSHADGIFEYVTLPAPVADTATVGQRPLIRPLRALPQPLRVGVLVADATQATSYLVEGDEPRALGEALTADPGKPNYGGFGGYEEHGNRRRAEEVTTRMWRRAGAHLLEAHQQRPLELVVACGHEESLDEMLGSLHPYLQALPSTTVVVDLSTLGPSQLADAVASEVERHRRHLQESLVERLLAAEARRSLAVVGLPEVLTSANAHAVGHLVVSGPFAKDGVSCPSCGWLGRVAETCPVCNTGTIVVDDIVAAAMETAAATGAAVDQVEVATPLDAHGIGAILRFPVPG